MATPSEDSDRPRSGPKRMGPPRARREDGPPSGRKPGFASKKDFGGGAPGGATGGKPEYPRRPSSGRPEYPRKPSTGRPEYPRKPGGARPSGDWKRNRPPAPGGAPWQQREGQSSETRLPEVEISPFIRKLARLKNEKNRLEFSQFLLEGKKLIRDVIAVSPDIIMDIYLADSFSDPEFINYVKDHKVRIKKVSEAEIRFLSEVLTPQGIVATARFSTLKVEWAKCRYVTLLDSIQDPGNLGSIFRTSLALGGGALILGKGTCDPYNSKVVRSSAHAFLQLPFEAGVDLANKIKFLRKEGFTILAATPHASTPITHAKMRKKVALLIGNEGSGVDPRLLSMADAQVSIPHLPKVESLNAAVAHGILMYELITGRD